LADGGDAVTRNAHVTAGEQPECAVAKPQLHSADQVRVLEKGNARLSLAFFMQAHVRVLACSC
jgi:hypothetical protein